MSSLECLGSRRLLAADWYLVPPLREDMVCVELFWEAWLGVGLLVLEFLPFLLLQVLGDRLTWA